MPQLFAPAEYRVFPRCPLPLDALNESLDVTIPPLIKGYLRLGGYIGGEPAWDPDFNTRRPFYTVAPVTPQSALRQTFHAPGSVIFVKSGEARFVNSSNSQSARQEARE